MHILHLCLCSATKLLSVKCPQAEASPGVLLRGAIREVSKRSGIPEMRVLTLNQL